MAKGTCGARGCERPQASKGWCNAHALRVRNFGDPLEDKPLRPAGPKPRDPCPAVGCDRKQDRGCRGYCQKHYQRLYAHGTLVPSRVVHEGTPAERFWAKVVQRGDCWIWTGTKSRGYGNFRVDGAFVKAHRFAYEDMVGEIPDGLHIDHLCRVRTCVNPAHLEPVTQAENNRRIPTAAP